MENHLESGHPQREAHSTDPVVTREPALRRPVVTMLVTLTVMAIVLGVAELAARREVKPNRIGFENLFYFDPEVGYTYVTNHVYPSMEWFGRTLNYPIYTNSRGLKGTREYPEAKTKEEIRVICFGDSSTNGMHFDSYPEYLEDILSKALPDRKVWVQNAGVNGYSSTNVARLAAREIPLFKPDFVIVNIGTNDTGLADRPDSKDFEMHNFGEFLARTGQYSKLITWVRRELPGVVVHPYQNIAWREMKNQGAVPRVSTGEMAENLRRIIHVARSNDARVILTLYPWLFYNQKDNNMPAMAEYGVYLETVRRVAREENVMLADLVHVFDRSDRAAFFVVLRDPKEKPIGLGIDNYHLNSDGAELSAAVFAEMICAKLEKDQPPCNCRKDAVHEIRARHESTPKAVPGFLNMVPPEEVWKALTPRMKESNARTEREQPGILGSAQ